MVWSADLVIRKAPPRAGLFFHAVDFTLDIFTFGQCRDRRVRENVSQQVFEEDI